MLEEPGVLLIHIPLGECFSDRLAEVHGRIASDGLIDWPVR